MIDFKIFRGPAEQLFTEPGVVNPRLIIEEGCWYLATDTAQLFLGVLKADSDELTLKRINEVDPADIPTTTPDGELVTGVIGAYINDNNELVLIYSTGEEDILGSVVADPVVIKIGEATYEAEDGVIALPEFATEMYVENQIANFATTDEVAKAISEAISSIEHPSLDNYVTKDEIEDFISEIPDEYVKESELADYANTNTVVKQKYEVLPLEGMFVSYSDTEVRVNTQHVDINSLPTQNAGDGSSDSYYYMTFRAYAPENATSVVEGQSNKMDAEHSELAIDSYGRKYTTIWAAIANKSGNAWSKFGDKSTLDKYLGFYYNFHWYNGDTIIGKDKVRVILTNDNCHDDLVPDAVARRIDDKVNAIKIPEVDLTGYATEEFVSDEISKIVIPSVEGFATEEFVNRKIAEAELADKEADLEAYYTKSEVDALIPSLEGYAKAEDIPTDYLTESDLAGYSQFSGSYDDLTDKPEIPSIDGLAKIEYVDNAIANIKHPTVDLTGYATEQFVNEAIANIELPEVPEINLNGYYTKEETDAAITEAVAEIQHPTVNLSGYALKSDLDVKANDVLFDTDKFVVNPIGGFVKGESLKGLTVAQLFAKLLELSDEPTDTPIVPDEPENPNPKGIIETIIAGQIPMYEIDETSAVIEMPYVYSTFAKSSEEDLKEPTQTSFYQKTENGEIVESGYQHVSSENDSMYYIIALPKDLDFNSNITTLAFDVMDASNPWKEADLVMTGDIDFITQAFADAGLSVPAVNTDTHKLWIDESLNIYDGSIYRFIINE